MKRLIDMFGIELQIHGGQFGWWTREDELVQAGGADLNPDSLLLFVKDLLKRTK
jgi:hypothetical protein